MTYENKHTFVCPQRLAPALCLEDAVQGQLRVATWTRMPWPRLNADRSSWRPRIVFLATSMRIRRRQARLLPRIAQPVLPSVGRSHAQKTSANLRPPTRQHRAQVRNTRPSYFVAPFSSRQSVQLDSLRDNLPQLRSEWSSEEKASASAI